MWAAPGGDGLALVAGLGPVGRPDAPIVGTARKPFEGGMHRRALQHPAQIVDVVGGEAQFRAVLHDPGKLVQRLGRNQAALVVTLFAPGIGKQDEDPGQASVGKLLQQLPAVFGQEADIRKPGFIDGREETRDPVLEDLAADQADGGMGLRLGGEMLAAAIADLQPDLVTRGVEERGGVKPARFRQGEGQPRQEIVPKRLLAGPQRSSAAPAIERPMILWRVGQAKAERSAGTRSSFSQEKPPSASGLRPKWP